MSDYDNTNRGALFKNDKGDNPKRPDYTGTLDVGGVPHKLSAWLRESKKGDKFLSISVEPSEPKQERPAKAKPQQQDDDELLPF